MTKYFSPIIIAINSNNNAQFVITVAGSLQARDNFSSSVLRLCSDAIRRKLILYHNAKTTYDHRCCVAWQLIAMLRHDGMQQDRSQRTHIINNLRSFIISAVRFIRKEQAPLAVRDSVVLSSKMHNTVKPAGLKTPDFKRAQLKQVEPKEPFSPTTRPNLNSANRLRQMTFFSLLLKQHPQEDTFPSCHKHTSVPKAERETLYLAFTASGQKSFFICEQ